MAALIARVSRYDLVGMPVARSDNHSPVTLERRARNVAVLWL